MAVDQVRQRKRKCVSKVKTGCRTCKVRKIKCDEAKPGCQRCSSTGRKCDGYIGDVAIYNQALEYSTDLKQRISVHISGSAEEKRGYDFFLRNTAAELSGYYESSFWERLILAASAQKSSLRHAVIAIGALHEDFQKNRLKSSTLSAEEETSLFAREQYMKAVGKLRKSLLSGKEESLTALMSCILFVCFDSLRGWFESAMVHLQSGLRILRDMQKSSAVDHIVDANLAPLLIRLSIQSIIYVEVKSVDDRTVFAKELMDISGKDMITSEEFKSLEEARNAFNQAGGGLFRAMWDGDLPVSSQPPETVAIFDRHISQLSLWNRAFEKFMISKSKDLTSREVRGAALLKIHHMTAKILASCVSESMSQVRISEDPNDFRTILNLSRPLIAAAEEDSKNGKPPFTFSSDLGLIGPLYYICIRCPTVEIRTAAMELLLRCPRREGMWDSVLVSQMIHQFWELEASYKDAQEFGAEVDEFGVPVPFTDAGAVHFAFFGLPAG